MVLNIKHTIEWTLRETTNDNIRKAIHILNNFIRDYDVPIKDGTLKKIIFLHSYFPFSKKEMDKYSTKKFHPFKDLSNEDIKTEIDQICEELHQFKDRKIETKLSKAFKLNDLKLNEFPFHCKVLKDSGVVSKPVLRSIDKYKIKQYIADARIKEAFLYILRKCKDSSYQNFENEIIIQSSRYNQIEKKWIEGFIGNSEFNIETTKITRALLDIIDTASIENNIERTGLIVTDLILVNMQEVVEFDFRMLNEGLTGVMINRIYFKLLDLESFNLPTDSCIWPSKTYDVDLSSLNRVNNEIELIVSHFIKPNDVDRFKIKVNAKLRFPEYRRDLLMNINFKTSKGILSGPPVFCIISDH